MTRRSFRRKVTEASQAYRWERDEALARAAAAERKADAQMDALVRARSLRHGVGRRSLQIVIECDDLLVHYQPTGDEYRRLAERIATRLGGLSRDYRGDLRQTPTQRALGL